MSKNQLLQKPRALALCRLTALPLLKTPGKNSWGGRNATCALRTGGMCPLWADAQTRNTVSSKKLPLGKTSCTAQCLMLWNPPNLLHFTGMHNQWCWWAGNDDPVTHRHRNWTTKAANFPVRVFPVGRIQCKIQQGCSSRILWSWRSGRDLMPMEKEEWRFPWIPTGSTQLWPPSENTDTVVLLSCKKRTAAG